MISILWKGLEALLLAELWFAAKICEWFGLAAPAEDREAELSVLQIEYQEPFRPVLTGRAGVKEDL